MGSACLLNTPFGDAIRFATGTRFLRYPEEEQDFNLEALYLSALSAARKSHGARSASEAACDGDQNPAVVSSTQHAAAQQHQFPSACASSTTLCDETVTLVGWLGPDDPENPENWSFGKRVWLSFIIGFSTWAVYQGGGTVSVGYKSLMEDFNIVEQEAFLVLSLYVFAYGAGALLFSPLSEMYQLGRNPPYYIPMLAALGLQIGAALSPSFAGVAICRLLVGFFISPLLATGGASLADIWGLERLPVALSTFWVFPAFCAPTLAPTLVVFAVERYDWRWTMLVQLFALAISAVLLLLLPETFIDNILYRRARRLRRLTGSPLFKSPAEVSEHAAKGFGTIMKEALVMPFKVTFLDPSILFAACYMGFCYANFFCFFDAFPVVFGEIYPFSLEQLGLAFLCSVVAPALAVPCYVIYQLTYMYPLVKKHGMPIVERRLEPALLSSVTAALGLWIFAWTSFARLHWIGPMIGAGLFVWSNCITFQCIFYYVILAYPKYVASALAANDFIRSAAAAGLVHGATPLFHSRVGLHGGVSLLAGLATCGIAGVFTLYFKGASLRARSRFAESPAQVEKAVLEKVGESEGAVEVRLGEEQA